MTTFAQDGSSGCVYDLNDEDAADHGHLDGSPEEAHFDHVWWHRRHDGGSLRQAARAGLRWAKSALARRRASRSRRVVTTAEFLALEGLGEAGALTDGDACFIDFLARVAVERALLACNFPSRETKESK